MRFDLVKFLLLSAPYLAEAAAVGQAHGLKRHDSRGESRRLSGRRDGHGTCEAVAETVHHTVTVFADSPSYPAASTDAVAELAAKRQLEARQFEGARLSFVTDTKTVVSTLSVSASTVTVTAFASAAPNTTVRTVTPEASTVTQTVTQMQSVPPSTVTQTVTTAESLPGGNATRTVTSTVTASCTGQRAPLSAPPIVFPTSSADAGAVIVSTVPLPGSQLPKTTLSCDPLAPPGEEGACATLPTPAPSSTPAPPPSPAVAPDEIVGDKVEAPEPTTTSNAATLSESVEATAPAETTTSVPAQPTEAAAPAETTTSVPAQPTEATETQAPETQSPKTEAVEPPMMVDLSTYSLASQLDLGGLVGRTAPPAAPTGNA